MQCVCVCVCVCVCDLLLLPVYWYALNLRIITSDIPLCRSNRFGNSSSPVIACLRAEYIFEMKLKLYGYGYMFTMDPENGVDSV